METEIYLNKKKCQLYKFKKEEELEELIKTNHRLLFGQETIFIQKSKILTEKLGDSIPDGFLIDLKDQNNPQIYLIEVELAEHDFYKHIFPQITKFISFFTSPESRKRLVEKLFDSIKTNEILEKEFKRLLGTKEIFKALTDAVENSQNILLVLDGDKQEIPEAKKAYSVWDKMVKIEIVNLYTYRRKEHILTLSPPFEEVDVFESLKEQDVIQYNEQYHLESVDNQMVKIYKRIKEKIILYDKEVLFNPQHYYISIIKNRNVAFIKVKRKKIHVVVMLPYKIGKKMIKRHKLSTLSKGVQDFYNGPCFRLTIEESSNLSEVVDVLKLALAKAA